MGISQEYAIVGDPQNNSAYIFSTTDGNLLHSLTQPGSFGFDVDVESDIAAVYAPEAGATHIYNAQTGALLRTLENPNGLSGSPSPAGSTPLAFSQGSLLVGDPFDDAAFLYDPTTGDLVHTFDNPLPPSRNQFGISVALSDDKAVISSAARGGYSADVFVFDTETGVLLYTLSTPDFPPDDGFGLPLDVSGSTLVIGAPEAGLSSRPDATAEAGITPGLVHVYDVDSGELSYTLKYPLGESEIGDSRGGSGLFGFSVAVSEDQILVGQRDTNWEIGAFLFDAETGELLETYANQGQFQEAGAVALDGNLGIIGSGQGNFSAQVVNTAIPEPATIVVWGGLAIIGIGFAAARHVGVSK